MQRKATVFYAGGQSRYNFSFPYLSKQFVKVRYDRATSAQQLEYNRDYTIEGQTVTLLKAAPSDVTVCIYRQTPTERLVDFNDGSLLLSSEMDKMSTQLLHVEEESSDLIASSAMVADDDNAWQGRGRRIKNLHDPIERQDAVTLNHLDQVGVARQDELQRIEQGVRADKESTLSFKNDAASSAQSASTAASNSAQSAAASDASRQASAESESKIKNMQVDVHAMQQHVDEVKTAIDGVAARAKADGQTASDAAVQAQSSAGVSAQSAAASEASAVRAEAATKYEGIVKSENLAEKSVHKKHLHQDAYESPVLTGTPTAPTAGRGTNNGQIASTAFVAQAVAALVNSAPGALDTLQELAAALGNDANFAATVTNALAGKVSKSGDTMTGALKFDENENTNTSIFPAHHYHRLFGGGSITYVHAYDTLPPPRKKTMYEIRVADGEGSFVSHIFTAEGLVSNLKGKADHAGNADHLGGQSLQWIIDQINAAKTGIVASNIAPNGWVKFANGLIVQWGMGSEQLSESTQTVTFPITFSRGCFSLITGTIISGDGNRNDSMWQVATVERERAVLFHQQFSDDVGKTKPTYIAIGV